MSRLEQLYQETILEHNKNPRNFKEISQCSHTAHGVNPLCGDDYHIYITLDDNKITDIGYMGTGCAISKSSASMMSELVKGKTKDEVIELKNNFLACLTQENAEDAKNKIGRLKIFDGVKKYPVRVKCATLIWRALEAALETNQNEISTE